MEFGEALKNIRLARNISQGSLYNNQMSRTSISKIEHGKQTPTYPKAIALIDKLGLSPNEFEYIRHGYKRSAKQNIINKFLHLSQTTQREELLHIKDLCQRFLVLQQDGDIKRIYLLCKALLSIDKEGFSNVKHIVKPIWNDLSRVNTWTSLDLYLINNILYFFNDETALSMTIQALKTIKIKYPNLIRLKTAFVLNESYLLMKRGKMESAKKLLVYSITLAKNNFRYDLVLLARVRLSLCNNDITSANDTSDLLKKIGATELWEGTLDEITNYKTQKTLNQ